ncbi:MAG: hypothetical protein ACLPYS_11845 [Vulcanimicrobiaceae bacterium]
MKTMGKAAWIVCALAALYLTCVAPLPAQQASPAGSGASGCIGTAGIERIESQARVAAAAGNPDQLQLWKQAADAAGACAQRASGDERSWFAYAQASDEFLSLPGEAGILARAPAIVTELDRLLASEKDEGVMRATRGLRDDVARAYRQTQAIVAARTPPVSTPEPTISPILLRGRGPLGL